MQFIQCRPRTGCILPCGHFLPWQHYNPQVPLLSPAEVPGDDKLTMAISQGVHTTTPHTPLLVHVNFIKLSSQFPTQEMITHSLYHTPLRSTFTAKQASTNAPNLHMINVNAPPLYAEPWSPFLTYKRLNN
jgi:hypothetical protein